MNISCPPCVIVGLDLRAKEPMRGITEHHGASQTGATSGDTEARRPPWLLDQTVTNWWWLSAWDCDHPVQLSQVVSLIDLVISVIINTSVHTDWQFTDNWKTQSQSNYRIPPPSAVARLTEAGHPQITMERIFISTQMHPGHVTLHPRHDSGVFESFVHCHHQPPGPHEMPRHSETIGG